MPNSVQNSVIESPVPAGYRGYLTAQGRVAWRPGLRWDQYDAYLFDIDGTLLRDPGRVHYNAFSKACLEVLGHPLSLEPVTVAGSTDPRILSDAFAAAGIADETWRPHQPRLLEAICATVERDAAEMQLTIMPGVVEALRHLAAAGKWLGVATGNLESIGWLKLERTGLRRHFTFGGFSDAHEQRANMIAAAAAAARNLAGAGASVVIVGDAGGGEGVTENARVGGAGYGDRFERERMAEDLEAGLGEGVVVAAAGIAQQGAVDVEEIGVVVVPGQAGTPGDAALRGGKRDIARRSG